MERLERSDIVSSKNTMIPKQENINIIHNCEELFSKWLLARLGNKGISINGIGGLSELLNSHEQELSDIKQHIKPLRKWNKIKDECYSLTAKLNGAANINDQYAELIEKTAFEGQILWLTLQ